VPEKNFILFAEDREPDADLIEIACFRAGIARSWYYIARSGREATHYLELVDRHEPVRLPVHIITDLQMPQMDGIELLSWVRAHPRFSSLPVTVLTHSPSEEERFRAHLLGCDNFLRKPAELSGLIRLIRELAVCGPDASLDVAGERASLRGVTTLSPVVVG
jgi:CheY-like chemotaxis protein